MSDKTKNLAVWDQVYRTDPSMTKPGEKGMTSIAGQYFFFRATELFGPCGIGWGYDIEEERFDEAGDILDNDKTKIGTALNHTIRIKLWYKIDDQRGEIIGYGHTRAVYRSKYGVTCDEEAPKKSLTDAIKKCLSMLGVGGDIHMGEFDDPSYKQEVMNEIALEKADHKDEELARQHQEWLDWLKEQVRLIETAQSAHEAKIIHKAAVRRADRRNDAKSVRRLQTALDKRIKELSEKKGEANV